jgi:branched-chain amino acid transport system ATP-binding protein
MTGAPPLLTVDRISRSFQGLRAVDDVSFDVHAGELLGLIGPNGAGKTTLFNMIAGALAPSAGRIGFTGADIGGLPPNRIAKLGIARTYQNLRVFPDLTVFDNVSVGAVGRFGSSLLGSLVPGAERHRARRIADATAAALVRLGLHRQADEPAGNLSYGQKKLLEIARALTLAPKLLLLDEPAAGLNPSETEALSHLVRSLSDEGLTILLVEHDMPMVMRVCTRIVVIDSGRKIAEGTPREIRADAAVRAAYLGDEA